MTTNYAVGIDVGTHSTGFCALELDDDGFPIQILNAVVFRHDSGVDPQNQKKAETRLAVSGQARRTRRLIRRRRKRYQALDAFIQVQGWPMDALDETDPYAPWRARLALVDSRIDDEDRRDGLLAGALRHMIRHRGWRSPYSRVESLLEPASASAQLAALRARVGERVGRTPSADATPAELVAMVAFDHRQKVRGPDGILGGKLMQSDNVNELRKMWEVQELDPALLTDVIKLVFAAESPRGSAVARVGKDPLPGQAGHLRAAKAHPAFQEFRIASVSANLRVRPKGEAERRLTPEELRTVVEALTSWSEPDAPSWTDISALLGITRSELRGTSVTTADGERASARPPIHHTNRVMAECKIKPLRAWWLSATEDARGAMVDVLVEGDRHSASSADHEEAESFLETLSDEELAKLEEIPLPAGRAAYSVDSLRRLTRSIVDNGSDLTGARISEFGVAPDWTSPAVPIEESVGNPAVDRVLKGVSRWLHLAEQKWGTPLSVNIEHVRSGLMSEAQAREIDRENNQRFKHNERIKSDLARLMGGKERPTSSDVTRYLAFHRQGGQCLYCGDPIDFSNFELDHIVPRAGAGSTNRRDNLAAVCEHCNRLKSNTPFATWAAQSPRAGVSLEAALERVKFLLPDPGRSAPQTRQFAKGVRERLSQTELDPPLDARSMESVAWMANELRHRIEQKYQGAGSATTVRVFRGGLTAEARRASGIDGQLALMGGRQKNRFDRRHHAVDAAVIAMMRPGVAQILAERTAIRSAQRVTRRPETWTTYEGAASEQRPLYQRWKLQMARTLELLNDALESDAIPVRQNIRLGLGNGSAHHETIKKFERKMLGTALSLSEIDRASTPALWCALTRHSDFDPASGLPENWSRTIRVHGTEIGPTDPVSLFGSAAAAIAVRGGYAEIGSTIHHARIYRIPGKRPAFGMVRVFATDLQQHRHEDLFSVELPPQAISIRTAEPKMRRAVLEGSAEYLGWLVLGDEIQFDPEAPHAGAAGEFLKKWPVRSWVVDGFNDATMIRIRPLLLAAEGLSGNATLAERNTIDRPGWRVAVNALFKSQGVRVVRRNGLGEIRETSSDGLPTSWWP